MNHQTARNAKLDFMLDSQKEVMRNPDKIDKNTADVSIASENRQNAKEFKQARLFEM
jgi:hypothetical protein